MRRSSEWGPLSSGDGDEKGYCIKGGEGRESGAGDKIKGQKT